MTSIDGASRPLPARSPSAPSRADPGDVRAMHEALEAARGRIDRPAPQPGRKGLAQPGGKPYMGRQDAARDLGEGRRDLAALRDAAEEPAARLRSLRESADGVGQWGGQGAAVAPGAMTADFPAAHVDPGAFAQMLADLWTRENGRGSKEVRVRFGDRAWPATGARLVRNAAGALDVALLVGDGGRAYGDRLAGLEDALGAAGVNLGSLAVETDG